MVLFLADEAFNGRIVRGLQRRKSDLDLIRAQDVGLLGVDDDGLLAWADENGRLLLTHDARTMPNHVLDRLATGMHLPGVFIVDDLASIGLCVEDILLVAECSDQSEWEDRICYLPFK